MTFFLQTTVISRQVTPCIQYLIRTISKSNRKSVWGHPNDVIVLACGKCDVTGVRYVTSTFSADLMARGFPFINL